MKGYTEWINNDRIGFITNIFGRLVYINTDWPDGPYEKFNGRLGNILKRLRHDCHKGRTFTKEELLLELL